jgi:hypothetical protein
LMTLSNVSEDQIPHRHAPSPVSVFTIVVRRLALAIRPGRPEQHAEQAKEGQDESPDAARREGSAENAFAIKVSRYAGL